MSKKTRKMIILSGPSCVGKTPLLHSLNIFYPELARQFHVLVCYNSRAPRPREREGHDYYFRSKAFIKGLKVKKGFIVREVRQDWQAVDLALLEKNLQKGDVFFEGNPVFGEIFLKGRVLNKIPKLSVFLSPLSREEIVFFKKQKGSLALEDVVTDIMRRKLLRRTKRQKGILSLGDLKNIEIRAKSALKEIKLAHLYQHIIVNHDGEDSEHWDAFGFPIGEARRALANFAAIVSGGVPRGTESWDKKLLG